MSDGGKGDKARPMQIDRDKFSDLLKESYERNTVQKHP